MGLKCSKEMPEDIPPQNNENNIELQDYKEDFKKLKIHISNLEKKINEEIEQKQEPEQIVIHKENDNTELINDIKNIKKEIQNIKLQLQEENNNEQILLKITNIEDKIRHNEEKLHEIGNDVIDNNDKHSFVTNYLKNELNDTNEKLQQLEKKNEQRWF